MKLFMTESAGFIYSILCKKFEKHDHEIFSPESFSALTKKDVKIVYKINHHDAYQYHTRTELSNAKKHQLWAAMGYEERSKGLFNSSEQ